MNIIGTEHFRIELVENFPCKSKEELKSNVKTIMQEPKQDLEEVSANT